MSEEYKYKYFVTFKFTNGDPRIHWLVTGYVPRVKMSDLKRYIQGGAADKKIIGIHKLTQRYYYEDLEPVGPNGEVDIV